MQSSSRLRSSTLDRPLQTIKGDVNISTFALLFSEMVQYSQNRSESTYDIETKLINFGQHVGIRMFDLCFLRNGKDKREIRLVPMLISIQKVFWKFLFNREAEDVERNPDHSDIYQLVERECIINKFITVPKDKSSLNCASFVAGILQGVLCASGFTCQVDVAQRGRDTVYIIKFAQSVIERESRLDAK